MDLISYSRSPALPIGQGRTRNDLDAEAVPSRQNQKPSLRFSMYSTLQVPGEGRASQNNVQNSDLNEVGEEAGGAVTFEKMARLYDATLRKLKDNVDNNTTTTLDARASVYGALRPLQERRSPEMP